jgi:hypothetical protein
MLAHIPALVSAFLGGVLLYLSIYLPIQSIIFAAILFGCGPWPSRIPMGPYGK